MKNKSYIWTILMGAGVIALAGCQSENLLEQDTTIREVKGLQTYMLTLDATKQIINEPETRALFLVDALNKHLIDAYWAESEIVKVFKDGSCIGTLNVTPGEGTRPQSATLSGEITTEGLAVGNELMLLFPRQDWDYTGQTGILTDTGSIATNYDYATATVEVASIEGNTITTKTGATFENEQSIYAFKLKLGNPTFPMKQFTISSAQGKLVQERSYSNGAWTSTWGPLTVTPSSTQTLHYVSMRNEYNFSADAGDELYFVAIGEDDSWTTETDEEGLLYMGSKAISADKLGKDGKVNGKYFTADVQMADVDMDPNTSIVGDVW